MSVVRVDCLSGGGSKEPLQVTWQKVNVSSVMRLLVLQ